MIKVGKNLTKILHPSSIIDKTIQNSIRNKNRFEFLEGVDSPKFDNSFRLTR
jgi:hypothetical protein